MDDTSDKALIAGCLAGRRESLEIFVRRFSDTVYRSIQHVFRSKNVRFSPSDLEDLHNTVFLKLLENHCRRIRQFKGSNGCSLASWIRIIAVRTVIDHFRKERVDALSRQKPSMPLEIIGDMETENPGPLAHLEKADRWQRIREGMAELLPRDRLFIRLHYLEGLSMGDVADFLGITEGNAYSLKHRALKRLRSKVAASLK